MDLDSFYPDDFCTGYVARGLFLSAFMGARWCGHVVYLDGFLGAPVALRQRSHFIIDLFNGRVGRSSLFCDVISDILIFVFLYVLIVYGSTFVKITSSMYYSYIYVPQAVVVISIPVSAAIMTLMNIENLVKDLRTLANIGAACEGGVRNG